MGEEEEGNKRKDMELVYKMHTEKPYWLKFTYGGGEKTKEEENIWPLGIPHIK